jgi:hypothetical protein
MIITVEPVDRLAHFRVRLGERLLLDGSRQPMCDAARILIAEGANPDAVLAMRHAGHADDALRAKLGAAAGLVVEEHPAGVRFARYREKGQAKARRSTAHAFALPGPPEPPGDRRARL